MAISKAAIRATTKYKANHYDVIRANLPKGKAEIVKGAAAAAGLSLNAYLVEAVRLRLAMDGYTLDGDKIGED